MTNYAETDYPYRGLLIGGFSHGMYYTSSRPKITLLNADTGNEIEYEWFPLPTKEKPYQGVFVGYALVDPAVAKRIDDLLAKNTKDEQALREARAEIAALKERESVLLGTLAEMSSRPVPQEVFNTVLGVNIEDPSVFKKMQETIEDGIREGMKAYTEQTRDKPVRRAPPPMDDLSVSTHGRGRNLQQGDPNRRLDLLEEKVEALMARADADDVAQVKANCRFLGGRLAD